MAAATAPACASPGTTHSASAASASGVTSRLTTGMATALASGDTSDTCWNSSASAGSRPTVSAACARAPSRTEAASRADHAAAGADSSRCRQRPPPHRISSATAPNDSQKPAASGAQGSSAQTSAAASANTREPDTGTRHAAAPATTASMKKVRRAGTPHPASRQYSHAPASAAPAAATWAGCRSDNRMPPQLQRFQACSTAHPASAASIVTCRPLMDTRWVMPVRLKVSQSRGSTPAWSPIARAASTAP